MPPKNATVTDWVPISTKTKTKKFVLENPINDCKNADLNPPHSINVFALEKISKMKEIISAADLIVAFTTEHDMSPELFAEALKFLEVKL